MIATRWRWGIQLGLAFSIEGAILGQTASAQLVPDATLGEESSAVTSVDELNERIDGGARRGVNLFHSFQEFNVGEGRGVDFANPSEVVNIFSRVTGGNPSAILGRLGVLGEANLFLINPNGILFGPNASLDVKGSFAATTANAIGFGDRGFFSATDLHPPSQLLTVNPAAFLFNQIAAQPSSIENQGTLAVPDGQNLLLVGGGGSPTPDAGEILINGGSVLAPGGRVELGGLSESGEISLNPDGSLSFPEGSAKADVTLTNRAIVSVAGSGGGRIAVTADELNILEESLLEAGIGAGLGSADAQAGDVNLSATQIRIANDSYVVNGVDEEAVGQAGNVTIETATLQVEDGASLGVVVLGEGRTGNVTIRASNVELDGGNDGVFGGVLALVAPTGRGSAGDVLVETENLTVSNGAQISVTTLGQGKSGNLTVRASEAVNLVGQGDSSSGIGAVDGSPQTGTSGSLTVETGRLNIRDGAVISTSTWGEGAVGETVILADDVRVSGSGSGIFGSVLAEATGAGSNLTIETDQLVIEDRAIIGGSTFGTGNAGNITIRAKAVMLVNGGVLDTSSYPAFAEGLNDGTVSGGNITLETESLMLQNGASISTSTFGRGDAGSLAIRANSVSVDSSSLFAINLGVGAGGALAIGTNTLAIDNNSTLATYAAGQGNAGRLSIEASDIRVAGGSSLQSFSIGSGAGGNLSINTGKLTVEGAQVFTSTFDVDAFEIANISADDFDQFAPDIFATVRTLIVNGLIEDNEDNLAQGNAGNLLIRARESVTINSDGFLSTSASGEASGGEITIETPKLTAEQAVIFTSTIGSGDAGAITVQGAETVELTASILSSGQTASGSTGDGGNIAITAQNLRLQDEALILSSTFGSGNAGTLIINADSIHLSGSGLSTQTAGSGDANNLEVFTEQLVVEDGAFIAASTSGAGNAGNISLQSRESITVTGISDSVRSSVTTSVGSGATGRGGNIAIATGQLKVAEGARVAAGTSGAGNAGDLQVRAQSIDVVGTAADTQAPSNLSATVQEGAVGRGGNLTIEAEQLNVREGAAISVATFGDGDAGRLEIYASESVEVIGTAKDGASRLNAGVGPNSTGRGGLLTVNAQQLSVSEGGILTSQSEGQADAGDITINARLLQARDGEISTSSTQAGGGEITATAEAIRLQGDSNIRTNVSSGSGNGGNITLTADSILMFDDSDIFAFARDGQGGNITLETAVFFGSRSASQDDPDTLDRNERVDINASGAVAGAVTVPDVSFIQNSLSELPESTIDPDTLIANSCVVPNGAQRGTFMITGAGGLPVRPGAASSSYSTGEVRSVLEPLDSDTESSWRKGDPIVEPTGTYRLPDGKLVLNRECQP